MISIVLPINTKMTRRAFYDWNTCYYLFESIQKYFSLTDIDQFFVVCQKSKVELIKILFRSYLKTLKIQILTEEELLPKIAIPGTEGYWIQQLVKLAVASHIQTDFYLTLDADIVCCKKIQYSDLVQEEKIIFGNQLRSHRQIATYQRNVCNSDFLQASKKIIGIDENEEIMYGTTPQILVRNVSLELQKFIQSQAQGDWAVYLAEQAPKTHWSEYGLYYSFLAKQKMEPKYYSYHSNNKLIEHELCITDKLDYQSKEILQQNLQKAFLGDKSQGLFWIWQSHFEASLSDRQSLLSPYINPKKYFMALTKWMHGAVKTIKGIRPVGQ